MIENISNSELLKYAVENGMLDMSSIHKQIEMKRTSELLEKHPYQIWEGKNGKWYTYLPDETKGRIQKERKTKSEIEHLVIEYWREQEENPTIREVFEEWNDRRQALGKISDPTHLRHIQIFNRHYKEFGNIRIKNITSEEICDFLEEEIADKELTAKAFSNLKSLTKGFLKRAKKRKLIKFSIEESLLDLDVTDHSFKKVVKEDYEEVFDEEETIQMINYLISNLDSKNIALLLVFVTGMRVGELVALKHEDFTENTVSIRRIETRKLVEKGKYAYVIKEFPKTDAGVRTIVIPNDYLWLIKETEELNPDGDFVFVNKQGNRITTNAIRDREWRNCHKLGIYQKSPHKIRKTYGSILLDNNVDKKLVTDMMGHTDLVTTEKHYHRNRKSQERKSQIISSLPDFQIKPIKTNQNQSS